MPSRLLPMLLLLVVLAVSAAGAPSERRAVLVVAHPEVPVDGVSSDQLQRIYLGKATRWEGDLSIHPVMLHDSAVHEAFVTGLLDRSPESFSLYWKRLVFTGKGRPPASFESGAALAAFVRATPGAIGYLRAGADTAGLKILRID